MKKLKLNAESLKVESFASGNGPGLRGTVRLHSDTVYDTCTYNRDCWTQLGDCSRDCTDAGWTCNAWC